MIEANSWIIVTPEWEDHENPRPYVDVWDDWTETMIAGHHTGRFRWSSDGSDSRLRPGDTKVIRYKSGGWGKYPVDLGTAISISNNYPNGFTVADVETDQKGEVIMDSQTKQPKSIPGTEIIVSGKGSPTTIRRARFDIKPFN